MTDLLHKDLGNVPAEMHGLLYDTAATAAALAAKTVLAAGVTQRHVFEQSDTGQLWIPKTSGVAASFKELLTDESPTFLTAFGAIMTSYFGCSTTDLVSSVAGPTPISAPLAYRNLSWASGNGNLFTFGGFEVRIAGTLDTTNMPIAGMGYTPGAGGNGATAGTAGTAGTTAAPVNGWKIGSATAGSLGGAGGTAAGAQGAAPSALVYGGGGSGGAGNGGGAGSGGAGGNLRAGAATSIAPDFLAPPADTLWGWVDSSTGNIRFVQGGAGGAGGGGGGGDGTAGGGGGGGGAGCIVGLVYCRKLILGAGTPVGAFRFKGSAGGNGGSAVGGNRGGGAGGGGGGGGLFMIVAGEIIGSATNFIDVSGGNGGSGGAGFGTGVGGAGGSGGNGGTAYIFELKSGTRKKITGTGGTAGGAASGNTGGTFGAGETTQLSWP